MGGIEVLAATLIFIVGAVGIIRGPAKELGVTMALVVLLAIFAQFDALVTLGEMPVKVNNILSGIGLDSDDQMRQRMVVVFLYAGTVIVTTFMAYHGQDTLAFKLKEPPGAAGVAMGWLVGALNGYLIFGTIWYYLHQLQYPIQRYVWFNMPLTELGEDLVTFLPQNLVGGMVLSAMALVLLWWRILK
jgi:hypothetical protein